MKPRYLGAALLGTVVVLASAPAARAQDGDAGGATSPNQACTSPYPGHSGLLYTDHTLFYAPGGEAYSYAGYGSSYSPYATSAAAGALAGSGTQNHAASTSPVACTRPSDAPSTFGSQRTPIVPLEPVRAGADVARTDTQGE